MRTNTTAKRADRSDQNPGHKKERWSGGGEEKGEEECRRVGLEKGWGVDGRGKGKGRRPIRENTVDMNSQEGRSLRIGIPAAGTAVIAVKPRRG